jgi:hypothetical protein
MAWVRKVVGVGYACLLACGSAMGDGRESSVSAATHADSRGPSVRESDAREPGAPSVHDRDEATVRVEPTPCFVPVEDLRCDAPPCNSDLEERYVRARALHDAGRFGESAALLDSIVRHEPISRVTEYAAQLAIDALHRSSAPACATVLRDTIRRYHERLCRHDVPDRAPTCEHLQRLECEARSRDAIRLADSDDLAAASSQFEALSNDARCAPELRRDALHNAATTAEHAGDAARAAALRDRAIDDPP